MTQEVLLKRKRRIPFERTSAYVLERRRYHLRKNGFLDNEVEALIVLPIYDLKRFNILRGRRNEVKNAMRDLIMSEEEAIEYIYEQYRRLKYRVLAGDYIEYYYTRGEGK